MYVPLSHAHDSVAQLWTEECIASFAGYAYVLLLGILLGILTWIIRFRNHSAHLRVRRSVIVDVLDLVVFKNALNIDLDLLEMALLYIDRLG